MATLPFVKMHGLGNDFIVVDDLGKPPGLHSPITRELARKMCDRRFGIGCDQLLWLKTPLDRTIDARMDILNPDGSTAEMCGNGIRAAALYLYLHSQNPRQSAYRIETLGGLKSIEVRNDEQGLVFAVDMGAPVLGAYATEGETIQIAGKTHRFHEINMGNPHAVLFMDEIAKVDLPTLGAAIENHPRFPNRTNVEIVQALGPREIQVRVWERGAGITLACGTGACASAVASLLTQRVQGPVQAHLPGGTLELSWAGGDAPVIMVGPAEEVFRGEYFVDES